MIKRLSFIITIIALSISSQVYAQKEFSGGKGTADEPLLISNVNDLETLNEWSNKGITQGVYFKLTNNITEIPFKGMIATTGVFEGVFDGNNHCVAVETNYPDLNYVGFIGFMIGATVKNLQVEGNVTGNLYVGGVVGQAANGCVIENVINYATVNAKMFGGGVVGQLITQQDMPSCIARQIANYGTVNGSYVGGVIGDMGQQVGNIVERIVNYGIVNGDNKSGGLIANARPYDYVYYGFNFGTAANDKAQGCIGNTKSTTIGELYYDEQLFCVANKNEFQFGSTDSFIGDNFLSAEKDNGFHFDYWLYENNMYPRLKMNGMESLTIPVLYATPLFFAQDNSLNNITKPFTVGTTNGVTWTSKNGRIVFNGSNAVPTSDGDDVITASLNGVTRSFNVMVNYTAGIDDVRSEDNSRVTTTNGSIMITVCDEVNVQIMNITGHTVINESIVAGTYSYIVPAGIYVVRIGNTTHKVCVSL